MFEGLLASLLYCRKYVRQVYKWIDDDDDHDDDESVLSSQAIDANSSDLTTILPAGAGSAVIGSKAGSWRVYPEVSFQGTPAILDAGRSYPTEESMGLSSPIKSIRKK